MTITCRRFKGEEDYFRLRKFIEESIPQSESKFYYNINSLEFGTDHKEGKSYIDAVLESLRESSFLLFEDDKFMGGAIIYSRNHLLINQKDKHRFSEMFKSLEEEVNKCIKENSVDLGISSFCESSWRPFDGDEVIEKVLIENGYYKTDEYWVLRTYDHKYTVEEPELPEGYYMKQLCDLLDISKVVEIYEQCLGMEFDEFSLRKARESYAYRDELDIVVMAPDNNPVALCSGRYDDKNKMVSFEAVACFKEHRKKGISKAMMLHALKAARDLGAEVSTVLTLCPEQFLAPNKLYSSVGFKLTGNMVTWKKSGNE